MDLYSCYAPWVTDINGHYHCPAPGNDTNTHYDCSSPGNSDMYGFGIRLGFYTQWLSGALAAVICGIRAFDERAFRDAEPRPIDSFDVISARSALFGFTVAVFIAILAQTATRTNTTLDLYISLLLCFGYFYSYPIKFFIGQTAVRASPEFDILQHSLLLAVHGFKLWFWAAKVLTPTSRPGECQSYGFLFYRLQLKSDIMRFVNIALDSCMVVVFGYFLAAAFARLLARYRLSRRGSGHPSVFGLGVEEEGVEEESLNL
jgi:hypothetical protein